jgi:hypothetical protein
MVDSEDLALLLGFWGLSPNEFDLNVNGTVDGADLTILLNQWGPCGN